MEVCENRVGTGSEYAITLNSKQVVSMCANVHGENAYCISYIFIVCIYAYLNLYLSLSVYITRWIEVHIGKHHFQDDLLSCSHDCGLPNAAVRALANSSRHLHRKYRLSVCLRSRHINCVVPSRPPLASLSRGSFEHPARGADPTSKSERR